jgi:hypothetical protein
MKQKSSYPDVRGNGPEVVETGNLLPSVMKGLDQQADSLSDSLGGISAFFDRLFGPQLEEAGVASDKISPSGIKHELDRRMTRNDQLIQALRHQIGRLGDIA